jgi:hypothetical protein
MMDSTQVDADVVSEKQDPLYTVYGKENIEQNKKYTNFDPKSSSYGNVYMQKARGRILFVISEMNTTRKLLNIVSVSNDQSFPEKRGAAYREALMEILTLDDATLGSYSVTSNALTDNYLTRSIGSMFTRKGGKRSRKSIRKTRKRSKK